MEEPPSVGRAVVEDLINRRKRFVEIGEADQSAIIDFDVPWEPYKHYIENVAYGHVQKPNFYSETFTVGSFVWKVLFTAQSEQNHVHHLSIFLDNTHVKDAVEPWQCTCVFKFQLMNTKHPLEPCSDMYTFHPNAKGETDRGYLKFQRLDKVERALIDTPDGQCFTVRVSIKEMQTQFNAQYSGSDTRAATGYVGLKNQGATCYLNAFLQTLFHLPAFRSATYRLPISLEKNATSSAQSPSSTSGATRALNSTGELSIHNSASQAAGTTTAAKKGVAFQLAKLFYKMQSQPEPPRTTELTESFGWTRVMTLEQHDIQELARILLENLETKMKGTVDERTIGRLFTGKQGKFIKCRDIDYTSRSVDKFQDIQLRVRECSSLVESIESELKKEELAGENKYHCVDHDKGIDDRFDADMGTEFLVLPPVLVMHLRRFEFDLKTYQLEKVNGYFAFPTNLNMSRYLRTESGPAPRWTGPVPSLRSDMSEEEWDAALAGAEDQTYRLHSVLVHSGHMHGGHYHAYVSPGDGGRWLKFDDATVCEVSQDLAVADNFGGSNSKRFWLEHSHKDTSAYMLLYVRNDMWDSICNVSADMPEDLESEFRAEDDAHREAGRHMHFSIHTVDSIKQHMKDCIGLLPLDSRAASPSDVKVVAVEKDIDSDVSTAVANAIGEDCVFWPIRAGVPVNEPDIPRDPAALQRSRRCERPKPLFKVPVDPSPSSDPSRQNILVFVKEYIKAPLGKGLLVYRGHTFVSSTLSSFDTLRHICDEFWPGAQIDNATDIFVESCGKLEERTALSDGSILVVSWGLCQDSETDVGMLQQTTISLEAPTEAAGEQEAETYTAQHLGIDRTNIFLWRYRLDGLVSSLESGEEKAKATMFLNIVWQLRALPQAPMSLIECYKQLGEQHTYCFHRLRDDGRKTDGQPTVLQVSSMLPHQGFVQELAPHVKHPPGNIRLWDLRTNTQLHSNPLGKHRLEGDLGYELLSFPLELLGQPGYAEMNTPFMSPQLKVLATVTTVVKKSHTVQQVLEVYRKELNQKLAGEKSGPKDSDELILVKVRDSRIDRIIPSHIPVERLFDNESRQSWECRVEVKLPLRTVKGETPQHQLLVRMCLIDIRDRVSFHGTPFLMYILPNESCEDIINHASSHLCLTAELRSSQLFFLEDEMNPVSVAEELGERARMSAYNYILQRAEDYRSPHRDASDYIPSLGIDKKRVHTTEKPIKIHN